jgi:hypothetical protein
MRGIVRVSLLSPSSGERVGVLRLRGSFSLRSFHFAQDDRVGKRLGEGGEFDQVGGGDLLYGVAGFAPGGQASGDDEGAEAVLPQ